MFSGQHSLPTNRWCLCAQETWKLGSAAEPFCHSKKPFSSTTLEEVCLYSRTVAEWPAWFTVGGRKKERWRDLFVTKRCQAYNRASVHQSLVTRQKRARKSVNCRWEIVGLSPRWPSVSPLVRRPGMLSEYGLGIVSSCPKLRTLLLMTPLAPNHSNRLVLLVTVLGITPDQVLDAPVVNGRFFFVSQGGPCNHSFQTVPSEFFLETLH